MAVIETMTFRLVDGADASAFMGVDKRVQSDFSYQQPGLVRRTTARGERIGEWIVIQLWDSAGDADGAAMRWGHDAGARDFMSFVDVASLDVRRYIDLD